MNGKPSESNFSNLRRQALKLLSERRLTEPKITSIEDARRLIAELQVHQIELELQNDELRRTQEQLAWEREKYADLYNFAPVAYFTLDERDIILDLNLNAAELLGNERKYLIGHPIAPYLTPDSFQKFIETRQAALETKLPQGCDLTIRRRKGSESHVHARTVALDASNDSSQLWRAVMTDITERKRMETELQVNEERFRSLVTSLSDIIYTLDAEQRHSGVFGDWVQKAGLSEDHFLGKTAREILGAENAFVHEDANRRALNGEVVSYEWSLPNGTETVYYHTVVSPMRNSHGEVVGVVGVGRDITERKRTEDELKRLNAALQEQMREVKELHQQLREQAVRDPLTGLFNRRYLQETLDREVARANREGKSIGFIIMDLDHFKRVNDRHGHKAGDMALQQLGNLLLKNLRAEDVACRYGGEEFTVMMPGASLETTLERANFLLQKINEMPIEYNGADIKITASMGVALFPKHGSNGEEAMSHADNALYAAKALGRNQVVVYDG
ncbi:MAG: diguanylate cyclase [Chloroflexi bacterium]|nr:diguanylate cyclase [Chloroflexota bacterium]MCA2002700.1 diguanylate cyclase [Chloroflexota bacterium]